MQETSLYLDYQGYAWASNKTLPNYHNITSGKQHQYHSDHLGHLAFGVIARKKVVQSLE